MNVRMRLQCGRPVTFGRCAAYMRQPEPECALGGGKADLGRRLNPYKRSKRSPDKRGVVCSRMSLRSCGLLTESVDL